MSTRPPDHTVPTGGPSMAAPVVFGKAPDDAELARTLAAAVTVGTLGTLALDPPGTPFGSVAPFGLDDHGRPVILISELAEHTKNLRADPRASMLVVEPGTPGGDPLAAGRVTLLGRGVEVDDAGRAEAKAVHLAGNPNAAGYAEYGDFSFWRLEVEAVRFVGGYGRMSWVDAAGWEAARPDPVAPFAAGAVEHLNADHADALLLMAQVLGGRPGVTRATATGVDRLGLELMAVGPDGPGRVRLAFDEPATTPDAIRQATIALTKAARAGAG